jgi:hypothetical protein
MLNDAELLNAMASSIDGKAICYFDILVIHSDASVAARQCFAAEQRMVAQESSDV